MIHLSLFNQSIVSYKQSKSIYLYKCINASSLHIEDARIGDFVDFYKNMYCYFSSVITIYVK